VPISAKRKAESAYRRRANRARAKPPPQRVRARPIIPGTRYVCTRRCVERRFFLTPDDENGERLNAFIAYALGVCLERYDSDLHAFNALCTHIHDSLTDLFGQLPAFKTTFHAWIARGINALRGRSDRFWSADQPVDVRPGDPLIDDEGHERFRFVRKTGSEQAKQRPSRTAWSKLLARVFEIDVTRCESCGGRLQVVETVRGPQAHPGAPGRRGGPPVAREVEGQMRLF
jgi:hypothetical protein